MEEGQLEDIREQEDEVRVSTRADIDKTIEDACVKIIENVDCRACGRS